MKFSDIVKSPIAFNKSGVYYTDKFVGRVRMRKGVKHISCQFYDGRERLFTTRLESPAISAPAKEEMDGLSVWATAIYDKDSPKEDDGFIIYSKSRKEARGVNRKLRETFSL